MTTDAIVALLQDKVELYQEHFVCLSFDNSHHLIANRTVFIGTLTSVAAHPREIFADPLKEHAAFVVVAHNHPSGEPTPSDADIEQTQQLVVAGQILGIPLRDHIIIARHGHYSFWEHGLLYRYLLSDSSLP